MIVNRVIVPMTTAPTEEYDGEGLALHRGCEFAVQNVHGLQQTLPD
ncbi:hypothetical protein ACFVH4_28090 [Nocardia ignorata]